MKIVSLAWSKIFVLSLLIVWTPSFAKIQIVDCDVQSEGPAERPAWPVEKGRVARASYVAAYPEDFVATAEFIFDNAVRISQSRFETALKTSLRELVESLAAGSENVLVARSVFNRPGRARWVAQLATEYLKEWQNRYKKDLRFRVIADEAALTAYVDENPEANLIYVEDFYTGVELPKPLEGAVPERGKVFALVPFLTNLALGQLKKQISGEIFYAEILPSAFETMRHSDNHVELAAQFAKLFGSAMPLVSILAYFDHQIPDEDASLSFRVVGLNERFSVLRGAIPDLVGYYHFSRPFLRDPSALFPGGVK